MEINSIREVAIPNPALKPFGVLVSEGKTVGTHGSLPNTVLHGRTTFEWFENRAFLMMRSEIGNPEFRAASPFLSGFDWLGKRAMPIQPLSCGRGFQALNLTQWVAWPRSRVRWQSHELFGVKNLYCGSPYVCEQVQGLAFDNKSKAHLSVCP